MTIMGYRLYRFDAAGHVLDYQALYCATDAEAIEQARKLATSERKELWSGSRLLAMVRANSAA